MQKRNKRGETREQKNPKKSKTYERKETAQGHHKVGNVKARGEQQRPNGRKKILTKRKFTPAQGKSQGHWPGKINHYRSQVSGKNDPTKTKTFGKKSGKKTSKKT